MQFAIIILAGKQYFIQKNIWYSIPLCIKNKYINLHQIILIYNNNLLQLGYPILYNSSILAKVISRKKTKKLTIIKTKPKKNYTKKYGFRISYSKLKIVN